MEECEACHQEFEKLYAIASARVCLRCKRKLKKKLKKASAGRK